MTHVVTENCAGCRFTDCVVTCPVQCFHGDGDRLYIDPDVCIDCSACIPACPVQAIKVEFDLAPHQQHWLALNAERASGLPVVSHKQPKLPSADARRVELGM
jgi:ferredoxin